MFLSGQTKRDQLVMGVNQEEECVVANWFAFEIEHVHRVAAQQHAETTNERGCPFFFAHLITAGIEPHHIPNL